MLLSLCLDYSVTHPPKQVTQIFGQPNVLLSSTVLKDALASWGKGAKLCNMQVERLLSQVKRSAPGKCPELERYISAGTLTQWHRGHKKKGGADMTHAGLVRGRGAAESWCCEIEPLQEAQDAAPAHPVRERGGCPGEAAPEGARLSCLRALFSVLCALCCVLCMPC